MKNFQQEAERIVKDYDGNTSWLVPKIEASLLSAYQSGHLAGLTTGIADGRLEGLKAGAERVTTNVEAAFKRYSADLPPSPLNEAVRDALWSLVLTAQASSIIK